ncbi:peptidoglycan-binding protein [Actinosynnema sp. NPDC059797]
MRRWLPPALAAVLVVGAGGVFACSRLTGEPPDPGPVRAAAADTALVERTDLATSVTIGGTLGFGPPTTLTGHKEGTLTWLPPVGTVVDRGEKLYEVNAQPVPLLFGDTPLYRTIERGMTPGPDVAELVANLRALGYRDPGEGDAFTEDTHDAVKRWQKNNGLPVTGSLAVGDVVVLPGKLRVASVAARPGTPATEDVLTYTRVEKVVSVSLDPRQVDVAAVRPGDEVRLGLPGGTETTGTTSAITNAAAPGEGASDQGEQAPQVAIVTIDDQGAVAGVDSGSVQVTVVTETAGNVLAVPVTALLALDEGGYALQVVSDDGGTRLVGVRTGMFAGGLVEVVGDGLVEGTRVVRAS